MTFRALPALAGTVIGFLAGGLTMGGVFSRPASAQFKGIPITNPTAGINVGQNQSPSPQPLEVQSLDGTHFVVATREPRLVTVPGRENAVQNMLCTVVTHYTVQQNQLLPTEHVRVPAPYRLVTLSDQ